MTRNSLPGRRPSVTFDVVRGDRGDRFIVSIGHDGATGDVFEVFITAPKIGSEVQAAARDAAILVSLPCSTAARSRQSLMPSRATTPAGPPASSDPSSRAS